MHQRFCQLGVVYRSIGDDSCSSLLLILSWCMRRVEQDEDEDEDDVVLSLLLILSWCMRRVEHLDSIVSDLTPLHP